MRKITHLFLLCALILVSTFAAKAQTAAEIQTSTAPTGGEFAADTHWFTIYVRGTYLSVENVDGNAYFYSGNNFNVINNDIDKGLWCVVGDDTNGYKLYNKSVGASKVFAINYVTGNTGGNARTKMVDATFENATTAGADNWLTTFNLHKNTTSNVGAYSISVKGLTNYYLNQRSPYMAFWISGSALEEIGSSFYFYNETSYNTSSLQSAKNLVTTFTGNTNGVFQLSDEELNALIAAMPDTTIFSWDALRKVNQLAIEYRQKAAAHTPVVGKRYLIKNKHNNRFIVPNVIPGSVLNVQTGNITKDAVWTLESGATEGTYKLKNGWSGLYINGVTANTTGTDFSITPANVYDGTAAIGTGTNYSEGQHTWLHGNQDPIILWSAGAGASRWVFTEVSEEDFNSYASLPTSHINTLIDKAKNFLGINVNEEKTALQTNPTYENYLTYYNKVKKGTDNRYVRFQCAKGNGLFMGLKDDYSDVRAISQASKNTNLSNIWKLVPVDNEETYKLMNANTGTYLTNLPNATNDQTTTGQLTDFDNAYAFTFTIKNTTSGSWSVVDGNGNQLNAETNSNINYWTDNGNGGWWILPAESIEVALHALGNASYATVYLPFSISAVTGANAYVANQAATANTLLMQTTEDGGFAANAGVVLVSDTGASTATLTLGANENTSLLSGTNAPLTLTDDTRANYLVFGPKDGATDTVGFWTPASTLTSIAANRAFYQNAEGQSVALKFDGSVIEGINNIFTDTDASAPIYDLTGRRVSTTLKGGIYIQNGKKFIVK